MMLFTDVDYKISRIFHLNSALKNLIEMAKSETPNLLAILALDEIIISNKKVGGYLVSTLIDFKLHDTLCEYVTNNLGQYLNYVEPENHEVNLIVPRSSLLTTDYHPFRKVLKSDINFFSRISNFV